MDTSGKVNNDFMVNLLAIITALVLIVVLFIALKANKDTDPKHDINLQETAQEEIDFAGQPSERIKKDSAEESIDFSAPPLGSPKDDLGVKSIKVLEESKKDLLGFDSSLWDNLRLGLGVGIIQRENIQRTEMEICSQFYYPLIKTDIKKEKDDTVIKLSITEKSDLYSPKDLRAWFFCVNSDGVYIDHINSKDWDGEYRISPEHKWLKSSNKDLDIFVLASYSENLIRRYEKEKDSGRKSKLFSKSGFGQRAIMGVSCNETFINIKDGFIPKHETKKIHEIFLEILNVVEFGMVWAEKLEI